MQQPPNTETETNPPSAAEKAQALTKKREQLKKLSVVLDDAFLIPGTDIRIGWDAIIGLVPVVGDIAGAALSGLILLEGAKLKVPKATMIKMLGNVGVEMLVGLVPVFGDLFDVSWRANKMNYQLIDKHINAELTKLGRDDLVEKTEKFKKKLNKYQLPLIIGSLLLSACILFLVLQ